MSPKVEKALVYAAVCLVSIASGALSVLILVEAMRGRWTGARYIGGIPLCVSLVVFAVASNKLMGCLASAVFDDVNALNNHDD